LETQLLSKLLFKRGLKLLVVCNNSQNSHYWFCFFKYVSSCRDCADIV